jgi:NADH-quinone oxidoreductase subunit F
LHAAQHFDGLLSEPVVAEVGHTLGVPLADLPGVIEFYAMFNRQPAGRSVVRVCGAPVCAVAGAEAVVKSLCRHLQIEPGEVSLDRVFTVEYVPCLGLYDRAPSLLVGETARGHTDPAEAAATRASGGEKKASLIGGVLEVDGANRAFLKW